MKDKIINECAKYGYILEYQEEDLLSFRNPNVREELQLFHVRIYEELEMVSMALIIDMGSWSDSVDVDLNDEKEILKEIGLWISEQNLKEVEMYFLEA